MPNEKILIVDDEAGIRRILSRTLEKQGFEVFTAASAEAALIELGKHQPDLVLSDIRMPGMTGVEMAKRIKEHSPTTSLIMITGYASTDTAIDSLRIGADDYLKKPVQIADLTTAVRAALDKRAASAAASQVNMEREGDVLHLKIDLQKAAGAVGDSASPSGEAAAEQQQASDVTVRIAAATSQAKTRSHPAEAVVDRLPYCLGRKNGHTTPHGRSPDLVVHDTQPYNVSRTHCILEQAASGIVVRDSNSTLGTVVNGKRIGKAGDGFTATLKPGENILILGNPASQYRYAVLVGPPTP